MSISLEESVRLNGLPSCKNARLQEWYGGQNRCFFTLLHVPHVLYMPYQRFTNGATVNHTLLHSNHAVSNLSQNSFTVGASHNDIFMVNV